VHPAAMKRPSIPFKPQEPSIHPVAVERDRLLAIGEKKQTEVELIAEIEGDMGLKPGTIRRRLGPNRPH
jgi:hypothetical protein